MNKWDTWYDSLPRHTREYLKNQPLWHDRDLALAFGIGLVVGFCLKWLIY